MKSKMDDGIIRVVIGGLPPPITIFVLSDTFIYLFFIFLDFVIEGKRNMAK